jgi:hypothetical protein
MEVVVMALDIDFNQCCIKARPIWVDWENRGFIMLLDLDYIICENKIVERYRCINCEDCILEPTDDDEIIDKRWSLI